MKNTPSLPLAADFDYSDDGGLDTSLMLRASTAPGSPAAAAAPAASPDGGSSPINDSFNADGTSANVEPPKKQLTDFDKQRVRLSNIIEVLSHDCDKMRHFAFLPIFFLMLVSILALLLWHRADTRESTSLLHFPLVVERIVGSADFFSLANNVATRSSGAFMDLLGRVLETVTGNLIETRQGALWVLPLAVLRQIRVENVPCWTGSAFFSDSRVAVNGTLPTCPGSWRDSFAAKDYSIFRRNTDSNLKIASVMTLTENIEHVTNEFIHPLVVVNTSVLRSEWNETMSRGFVDSFTRGLVADMVFTFPQTGAVVVLSIYWISTDGGLVLTGTHRNSATLFSLQRGVISLDTFILFLALILLTITLLELYDNFGRIDEADLARYKWMRLPRLAWLMITPWQVVTFLTLSIIVAITVIRLKEWSDALQWASGVPQISSPTKAALFTQYQEAVQAVNIFKLTYELYGYAFMLMVARFGYATQYLSKLSLVARTFREAVGDLVRVGRVFAVSLLIFAMIFHAIWGQVIPSMRTLSRTAIVLLRCIISGDADATDYAAMREGTFSVGADILLACFYVLFWLLLMNFVTSIISSAFMNNYVEERRSDTIMGVIQTYVLFNADFYYIDRFHDPEQLTKMGAAKRVASAALAVPPAFWTRVKVLFTIWRWRVQSLNQLQNLQKTLLLERKDPTVARHELPGLMPLIDDGGGLLLKKIKSVKHFFQGKKSGSGSSGATPASAAATATATTEATNAALSSPVNAPRTKEDIALAMKKIAKVRKREAGKRAIAFLVNELFDAVHMTEMSEARVALDTHAKTINKLNNAAERIKMILMVASDKDPMAISMRPGGGRSSNTGSSDSGGDLNRQPSRSLSGFFGVHSRVASMRTRGSKNNNNNNNDSGIPRLMVSTEDSNFTQTGDDHHNYLARHQSHSRAFDDGADSDLDPNEFDTSHFERQLALRQGSGGLHSNMSGFSSSSGGGGRGGGVASNPTSFRAPPPPKRVNSRVTFMNPNNTSHHDGQGNFSQEMQPVHHRSGSARQVPVQRTTGHMLLQGTPVSQQQRDDLESVMLLVVPSDGGSHHDGMHHAMIDL